MPSRRAARRIERQTIMLNFLTASAPLGGAIIQLTGLESVKDEERVLAVADEDWRQPDNLQSNAVGAVKSA